MVAEKPVSIGFAVVASLLGLASIGLVIVGQSISAIPIAILAVGAEFASWIHAKS